MPEVLRFTKHEFLKEIPAGGQQNGDLKCNYNIEANALSRSNVFQGQFKILKQLSILF